MTDDDIPSASGMPLMDERPHVLVVDDSPTIRQLVREVLEGQPLEAEVIEATDGAAALKVALEEHIDCVVCDVKMPRLDGMSFLKQLRQRFTRFECPLIFLTVVESTRDKVAGFSAGASDFLVKPIEPEEIVARVETHVQLARMHRSQRALTERLKVMVDTDSLTGVASRRLFMRNLRSEFGRAERRHHRLGLLIIDVDRFKQINDERGHQEGDRVLRGIAQTLAECARQYDTVARLGGEEFGVLLPEIERESARQVAERMRKAVEEDASLDATISIGVAFGPAPGKDHAEALFKRADDELYAAKEAGRNRVMPLS